MAEDGDKTSPSKGSKMTLEETLREEHSSETSKLQKKMNEMRLKHREELYWLKLELDTARREKEALEDRMAELYRDLQEMNERKDNLDISCPSNVDVDAVHVVELQNQVSRHDEVVRIMNHQMSLVRSSSETVIRSLKDEISDLMDDKCRVEMDLMNQVTDLEQEKRTLEMRVQISEQHGPSSPNLSASAHMRENREIMLLKADVERLTEEKKQLRTEVANERSRTKNGLEAKENLLCQVEKLKGDILILRSSAEAVQRLDQMKQDREENLATLERVALLWDRADESIQSLEPVMIELKPRDDQVNDDREHLLSTLETASLVHGQVKVSLMLIELKLRNSLAALRNDQSQMGTSPSSDTLTQSQVTAVQNEAMEAICQVEEILNKQIEQLEQKSAAEMKMVKKTLTTKVEELQRMQGRQKKLEQTVSKLQKVGSGEFKEERSGDESVELFVSRQVLERLQKEVLQTVERVREKNEMIGRLTATVEEHKVREHTLMNELKRLMKERVEQQQEEMAAKVKAALDVSDSIDGSDAAESGEFPSSHEYRQEPAVEAGDEDSYQEETVAEEYDEVVEEDETYCAEEIHEEITVCEDELDPTASTMSAS